MDICQEALCPTFAGMNKAQLESESEVTPEENELQLQLSVFILIPTAGV